jgi:hypothetical protein
MEEQANKGHPQRTKKTTHVLVLLRDLEQRFSFIAHIDIDTLDISGLSCRAISSFIKREYSGCSSKEVELIKFGSSKQQV